MQKEVHYADKIDNTYKSGFLKTFGGEYLAFFA